MGVTSCELTTLVAGYFIIPIRALRTARRFSSAAPANPPGKKAGRLYESLDGYGLVEFVAAIGYADEDHRGHKFITMDADAHLLPDGTDGVAEAEADTELREGVSERQQAGRDSASTSA